MKIVRFRSASLSEVAEIVPAMQYPFKNEIEMGEWQIGSDPDELITTGLGACVGLAAYNSSERLGLVGHFSDVSGSSLYANGREFQEAINSISALGEIEDTYVWLGGVRPIRGEALLVAEHEREFALHALSDFLRDQGAQEPENQITVDWTPQGEAVDLGLSCSIGTLVVHQMPENFIPKDR